MGQPYSSRPVRVESDPSGWPLAVAGNGVDQVREEWLVEDGWWTQAPLRRHYFELVLEDGRNVVVYRDESGKVSQPGARTGTRNRADGAGWYLQRA